MAPTMPTIAVERPSPPAAPANSSAGEPERVFVVYGHDETAREQLELVLRRLDLDPFVLGITAGSGLTIIEALENEILSPKKGKWASMTASKAASPVRFMVVIRIPNGARRTGG